MFTFILTEDLVFCNEQLLRRIVRLLNCRHRAIRCGFCLRHSPAQPDMKILLIIFMEKFDRFVPYVGILLLEIFPHQLLTVLNMVPSVDGTSDRLSIYIIFRFNFLSECLPSSLLVVGQQTIGKVPIKLSPQCCGRFHLFNFNKFLAYSQSFKLTQIPNSPVLSTKQRSPINFFT